MEMSSVIHRPSHVLTRSRLFRKCDPPYLPAFNKCVMLFMCNYVVRVVPTIQCTAYCALSRFVPQRDDLMFQAPLTSTYKINRHKLSSRLIDILFQPRKILRESVGFANHQCVLSTTDSSIKLSKVDLLVTPGRQN